MSHSWVAANLGDSVFSTSVAEGLAHVCTGWLLVFTLYSSFRLSPWPDIIPYTANYNATFGAAMVFTNLVLLLEDYFLKWRYLVNRIYKLDLYFIIFWIYMWEWITAKMQRGFLLCGIFLILCVDRSEACTGGVIGAVFGTLIVCCLVFGLILFLLLKKGILKRGMIRLYLTFTSNILFQPVVNLLTIFDAIHFTGGI